tara:strand:+ start:744 stop:2360 length:1617 start_codon:yes stop_codon:yes gene_type:complete
MSQNLVYFSFIFFFTVGCAQMNEQRGTHVAIHNSLYIPEEITSEELELLNKPPILKAVPISAVKNLEDGLFFSKNDVWERIKGQLHLNVPDNKRVQRSRRWYLKHPKHLLDVSKRAEPFMYMIVKEVERRGLPLELALLPIIESSFDPFAYSHGSASGVWQFTAPTAKHFGLKINWWYDGRRDVPAATVAALDMMEYLYKRMNKDWLCAIAAYNTGEGRLRRAIRRNKKQGKPTDFWSLDLPTETERYVPQLLALADVIKHSKSYGIKLHHIKNEPKVNLVELDSQIDLAFAAEMADMTLTELHHLNPAFNRWATAPDGPHKLLLPISKIDTFKTSFKKVPPERRLKWKRYQVQKGDTLSTIADKFDTSSEIIRTVNKLKNNKIVANQHLLILVSSQDASTYKLSLNQRKTKRQQKQRGRHKINYTVKAGDSFWKIARKYKTTSRKVAHWNHMSPRDGLRIGQRLVLWTNDNSLSNVANHHTMRTITYKVRKGDSLARIARKFQVSIKNLKEWNHITSNNLKQGKVLRVYVDVATLTR